MLSGCLYSDKIEQANYKLRVHNDQEVTIRDTANNLPKSAYQYQGYLPRFALPLQKGDGN
jgi:hypothetical protein